MEPIKLTESDPTVTVALTLGTYVGERCVDPGSHEEPPAYEPVTLLEAIVDRAAHQLVQKIIRGSFEWHDSLRDYVYDVREQMVRDAIGPMVQAALDEPLQRTNSWGDPIGDPRTIRTVVADTVVAEAKEALGVGKARHARQPTVLERLVAETVPAVLTKELAAEVAEAKATLRGAVAKSAAQVMADALASVTVRD